MNPTKIKILASTVTLALAQSAMNLHAQSYDYRYDSPYPVAPTRPFSGPYYATTLNDKLYLGFDAGLALQQDITISDSIGDSDEVTFDPGVRLDMMLGYKFTGNWAAEVELGLIANDVSRSYALGTDFMSVTYIQFPVLVNGIYTLPLNKSKSCSAYVGAGVGGIFSKYSNEFGGETPGDSAFAFQGMVGIKYAINQRWDFGIAYKFLGTTGHDIGPGWDSNSNPTEYKSDGTMTHSILATLTCKF